MKVIHENPYRLLGVYANSPAKERVANMNRLKRYMQVGKQMSFPLDLPGIMGDAARTDESIAEANSRLTLPKDQFHYAQFWFVKLTPLDDIAFNHLASGDTAKAIEIWGKKASASSYQNIITCSLARRDYATAIRFAEALYVNTSYVAELAEVVTGNRDIVTAKAASMDFIDTLCDELSLETILPLITNADWKRHLTDRTVKPLIESIEAAISAAEKANGPTANYNAGVKLMNSTKQALTKLRELIGLSDMQYRLIADKLSMAILQCGINYFNDSEDDDALTKAMTLQGYALSIAVGDMAKERCENNVEILRKFDPEEYRVRKELQSLAQKLHDFENYPKSTGLQDKTDLSIQSRILIYIQTECAQINERITNFIESCEPDLISMKSKLEGDCQIYIRISSAIASTAINALVGILNEAQRATIISNIYPHLKLNIKELFKQASKTMILIGGLDMDEKCADYYNSNNSTVREIAGLSYVRKKKPFTKKKSVKESTSVSASAETSSNDDKPTESPKHNMCWDKLIIGFIIAIILFIIIIFIQANNSLKHYEQEKNIDTLDTPVDQSVDDNYYNNYYNSGYEYEYEYENGSSDYDEYEDGGYSS